MGAADSSLGIADYEDAIKHKHTTTTEQSHHGWLSSLTSPQIEISSDLLKATLKKSKSNKHYRLTCAGEYKDGVHMFQFRWKPDSEKNVSVGICTRDMKPMEGEKLLLGAGEESVGWNILERKIYFNGCAIKNYPEKKPLSYKVPEKFTMVLNMDQGTLSFKADGEDLGLAMSGLKHIASELLVVASLSTPGDSLEMRYLGGSDSFIGFRKPMEDDKTGGEEISFHDLCGNNIQLTGNNTKAERKNPKKTFNSATVLTNRELQNDESVKITIEEMDTENWSGSLVLGVTTVPPESLQFPEDAMSEVTQGNTWAVRMQELKHNGKYVKDTSFDLDDGQVGDVFKIMLKDNQVMIMCNSTEVINFPVAKPDHLYACVDVYGQTTTVSISRGSASKAPSTKRRKDLTVTDLLAIMNKMHVEEIPVVFKGISTFLKNPSYGMHGKKKTLAASELSQTTTVNTIKSYMQYLSKNAKKNQAIDCYKSLISLLLCYTDVDVQFAKKLGDAGVLNLLMDHVTTMDSTIFDTKNNRQNRDEILMVLHNAAQARENRKTFHNMKFVKHVEKFVQNQKKYGTESGMIAVMAMSYVHLPSELPKLHLDKHLSKHVVDTLNQTISSGHSINNWTAKKLVSGIANVALCKPSSSTLIGQDILTPLLQMLDTDDLNDKESALNVIWSLTNEATMIMISATDGLMKKVQELSGATVDASVRQAALRVLAKLQLRQKTQDGNFKECPYRGACQRFLNSLEIDGVLLNSKFDMCYCENCHANRGDDATYTRGDPEKSYGIPVGWCRFGLAPPPRTKALNAFEKWHRAFHGTQIDSVKHILQVGELAPAGRKVLGGKEIKELDGHFSDSWYKPDGFNTKRIFLSPSMRYSGVPAYAKPKKFTDSKSSKSYLAQAAFQVLVNPNSYSVEKETIGGGDTPIDPNFNNAELEWVVEEQGAVILYGIVIRLKDIKS